MLSSQPDRNPSPGGGTVFATTHWSVVLAAGQTGSPHSSEALEKLCGAYWYPVYGYIRRRGYEAHDAQDLTQEFFAQHLRRNFLAGLDQSKGRFRSFLSASINHFLSNQKSRQRAAKRGGQFHFVSLDDDSAEKRYLREPMSDLSPEKIFEQRWAFAVFAQAMVKLRQIYAAAGKDKEFESLKGAIAAEEGSSTYATVGVQLKMKPGAVAVAVHRMRLKYRELVREEIAHTVSDPAEAEEELQHLLAIVRES